eukprot:13831317-Alexandrium_andersonii.AAC.1
MYAFTQQLGAPRRVGARPAHRLKPSCTDLTNLLVRIQKRASRTCNESTTRRRHVALNGQFKVLEETQRKRR